jgi:glutaminyl-peptide cyclotransferase
LRFWSRAAVVSGFAIALVAGAARAEIPRYRAEIIRAYPHDPQAFTEGLFFLHGALYESTGLEGRSEVRKEDLETGRVLQRLRLAPSYFGEGIAAFGRRLYELTWKNQVGFIYDLETFRPLGRFAYQGEGWALTEDGRELIMSDGSPVLRFLDPATLKETHRVIVTADGAPVAEVNELEWVKGAILANIWMTDRIARIDPVTGRVTAWIDLSGLRAASGAGADPDAVANGIAYDAARDRLFVTGKLWPKLFEIRLAPAHRAARE